MLGEIQSFRTAGGDQDFETLVASQIYQDARIMRIVLNNQKNRIPRFEIQSIVRELFDDTLLRRDLQRRRSVVLGQSIDSRSHRRPGVFQRQIENEGAAFARRAPKMNLATQQARKLTADGQT